MRASCNDRTPEFVGKLCNHTTYVYSSQLEINCVREAEEALNQKQTPISLSFDYAATLLSCARLFFPVHLFQCGSIAAHHSLTTMTLFGLSRWVAFLSVALLSFPWRARTDSPSPLSIDDFAKMFESIPGTGNGSCLRVWKPSPYPQPRTGLSITLQALADAKDMSTTTSNRLLDYMGYQTDRSQDKALRLLLFLFFGITFNDRFYPSSMDESSERYTYVWCASYQYPLLICAC